MGLRYLKECKESGEMLSTNRQKISVRLSHRGASFIYNKERARACEKFGVQRYNTTEGGLHL